MIFSLFSAKGSPGVTSSALALAATWPRQVVLLEADPSGSDLVYRCRNASGGQMAPTPNLLGLVSAARASSSVALSGWTQRLGAGVDVVSGITSPSQARGMRELWPALVGAVQTSEVDVIADLGRLGSDSPTLPIADASAVRVPVLAASLDSIMHTREMLKGFPFGSKGHTVPLVLGPSRTATADREDVDEVLAAAGLIAAPSTSLPLDHPGLVSMQAGASVAGRLRASSLLRGARSASAGLLQTAGSEVTP
jgi:hypothetical protein